MNFVHRFGRERWYFRTSPTPKLLTGGMTRLNGFTVSCLLTACGRWDKVNYC